MTDKIAAIDNLLAAIAWAKVIYGRDWIVAYDLQKAEMHVRKERRALGAERAQNGNEERARSASRG